MMTESQIADALEINLNVKSTSQKEFIARVQEITTNNNVSVDEALDIMENQSKCVFDSITAGIVGASEPKEKVYKIKRSVKGARIKVVGFKQSFSFGPIWCQHVKSGKGPALKCHDKVRAHAISMGMSPAKAKVKEFAEVLAFLQSKLA